MAHFKHRWWPFHWLNDFNVKHRGRQDGMALPPLPAWETEHLPPFVAALRHAGQQEIYELSGWWARRYKRLRSKSGAKSGAHTHPRQHLQAAKQEFQQARERYVRHNGSEPPSTGTGRRLIYGLWLLLLFIFELPLNSVVFRVFGESEVLTIVFTCGVSIVLLLCAHELGQALRGMKHEDPAARLFIPALILFPVLIIIGVAYAREAYLSALPAGLQAMNPWLLYTAFAAINLTIFTVAAVMSYRYHEPGMAEVARAWTAKQRAATLYNLWRKERERVLARRQWIEREANRLFELYQGENLSYRDDRGVNHPTPLPAAFLNALAFEVPPELQELEIPPTHNDEEDDDGPSDRAA